MNQITQDRNTAIKWARSVLDRSSEYYILDTETTGLDHPEVIELAVIDLDGQMILNQRFCPRQTIEPGATAVHGLDRSMLIDKPTWDICAESIDKILRDRKILIYNFRYDYQAIQNTYRLHYGEGSMFGGECVMAWYSQFFGHWDDRRKSYRWQKLTGGDHTALGDCLATLDLIYRMAGWEPTDDLPSTAANSISAAMNEDNDLVPF